MGIVRLDVGDRGYAVVVGQGVFGQRIIEYIGHLGAGYRAVVIGEIAALDNAALNGVIDIGLIPGGAVRKCGRAGGVYLVHAVGHDEGLGDGELALGFEPAAARAVHKAVLMAGGNDRSRPIVIGNIGILC